MHIKHAIEKVGAEAIAGKKQMMAKKMGKGNGGSVITTGHGGKRGPAPVPSYLKVPKGKGEKAGYKDSHKLPQDAWEI